jgi:uncharacterized membrane protein
MPVRRTALFLLGGLLLGAGMHIAVVLMVPLFAVNDAWGSMPALGADGEFHTLPTARPDVADERDPHLMEAVCRFSLSEGPVRIVAALPDGFWSLAIFDRQSRNLYSINDRAGDATRLDVVVTTPEGAAELSETRLAALPNAIVAALAIDDGIAVLRVFLPDRASIPAASAALAAADCNAAV